jgi:hypothetical protein
LRISASGVLGGHAGSHVPCCMRMDACPHLQCPQHTGANGLAPRSGHAAGVLSQRGPATQALTATQPGFGTQSFGGMSQVLSPWLAAISAQLDAASLQRACLKSVCLSQYAIRGGLQIARTSSRESEHCSQVISLAQSCRCLSAMETVKLIVACQSQPDTCVPCCCPAATRNSRTAQCCSR